MVSPYKLIKKNNESEKSVFQRGGVVAGATYSWSGPNGYSSAAQNPTITGASAAEVGTYSVVATASGCTGQPASVTVSLGNPVPSSPAAIIGSGGGPSGQTELYSVAAVNYATYYTWTVPSGSTVNSGQGTTSTSVSFGNTSGQICVTAGNTCGTSQAACKSVVICGAPNWIVNSTGFTQNNDTYRSSSYDLSYPATNTVDGVTGDGAGRWVSNINLGMPQWVAYDLVTTHYVTDFRLWNLHSDHPNQGVKDFKLQVADGIGGPWTDVLTAQAVNQSSSWQEFTLPSPTASRYWRMLATSGWDTTYGWVQLLEVGWKGCN